MLKSLREQYFGTDEEIVQEDSDAAELAASEMHERRSWLEHPFTGLFRKMLDAELENNEPQAGTHVDLLHNAGTRNGLLIVKRIIGNIERELRGD